MVGAKLVGIVGDWGGGKTLYTVRQMYRDYLHMLRDPNFKVENHTNIEVKPPLKRVPLDIQQMIDQRVTDARIYMDEGYLYAPSKRSMSASNIDLVNSIQQIRKRNIDVYWTFQDRKDTERQLREKANYYIIAEHFKWGFRYTILKRQYVISVEGLEDRGLKFLKFVCVPNEHAEFLYKLYDHKQIISIQDVKQEREEYNQRAREERKAMMRRVAQEGDTA